MKQSGRGHNDQRRIGYDVAIEIVALPVPTW